MKNANIYQLGGRARKVILRSLYEFPHFKKSRYEAWMIPLHVRRAHWRATLRPIKKHGRSD